MERGTAVTLERLKWPDHPHYRHRGTVLGRDAGGVWVATAPQPFYRGDEIAFHAKWWAAQCIPDSGGWWATFFPAAAGAFDIYVDIGTAPRWEGAYVSMVDVDLDVIRFHDGRVEIVDRDELVAHTQLYEYPQWLVDDAVTTADAIQAAIVHHTWPFDGAADAWLALLPVESSQ